MNTRERPPRNSTANRFLIDARRELAMPSRRLFGKRLLTLGGLTMLTGCSTDRRRLRDQIPHRGFAPERPRAGRSSSIRSSSRRPTPKHRFSARSRLTRSTA